MWFPEWISKPTWSALAASGTTAHRMATGSQMWLERFGPDLLLSYQTEAAKEALLQEIDQKCELYEFKPARIFGKFLPHQAAERAAPALLRGDAGSPLVMEVVEAGTRYGIDFGGGYSAGLFIDQRENRAWLREMTPKRLLNTFAYTCSFSVVGAQIGAETLSVDLSKRSLARGEENFRRNQLDLGAGHRFIADDVLAVLPRLARRGEKFDVIILDPPTFSRNQSGGAFQVQRDFQDLVVLALEVASPGARILLSVNHSAMRVAELERAGRGALRVQKRGGEFSQLPPLADFPSHAGAKTIWMEVK